MTQLDLARSIGSDSQTVSRWERDVSLPHAEFLGPLRTSLGVTIDFLLRGITGPAVEISPTLREFLGTKVGRLARKHGHATCLAHLPGHPTAEEYAYMTGALIAITMESDDP